VAAVTPTIDDVVKDAAPSVDYQDWTSETTRVLVFTDDAELYPKDRLAADLDDARAQAALVGRILEVNEVPHRWFIRVPRVRV
jgi:hypothetical protein